MATLKRCLKIRGMTYADLARAMDLSESTVKRLFSRNSLSMDRFERICQVLELSIFDVSKMARDEYDGGDPQTLSHEQEQALADNIDLLIVFHLILNGWAYADIEHAFKWTEPELIKLYTTLDGLALISLLPQNEVKILTSSHIRWRKDGAVKQRYQNIVVAEFMDDEFLGPGNYLNFDLIELSAASLAILQRKLALLNREITELSELDRALPQHKKENTGLLIATRPWVFSLAVDSMSDAYKKDRSYG